MAARAKWERRSGRTGGRRKANDRGAAMWFVTCQISFYRPLNPAFKRTLQNVSIIPIPFRTTRDIPFRPPVKNIFTIKTCSAAIASINPPSIKLKLNILLSVLLTVLKFRFSRVRKYFCCLVKVEIWPESFSTVSSTPLICSGLAPAFCGRLARASFSTCMIRLLVGGGGEEACWAWKWTHCNLKVHSLVGESRHRVVEAESVLSDLRGCENKVALSLFLALHYHSILAFLPRRAVDGIVD